MKTTNKIFLLVISMIACVGLDQATKVLATVTLKGKAAHSFLGNTFRLEYAENPGAFLGMGSTLPDWERWALLTVASSVVLGLLLAFVCLRKDLRVADVAGYALILAGGVSNMIDRVMAGAVVDFLNMGIGSLRTGIFNVADMAIMAGLFVVVGSHVSQRAPEAAPAETRDPKPETPDAVA